MQSVVVCPSSAPLASSTATATATAVAAAAASQAHSLWGPMGFGSAPVTPEARGVLGIHQGDDSFTAGVDVERECYPAGQVVGAITELVPAGELVRRFVAEAEATLDRLAEVR